MLAIVFIFYAAGMAVMAIVVKIMVEVFNWNFSQTAAGTMVLLWPITTMVFIIFGIFTLIGKVLKLIGSIVLKEQNEDMTDRMTQP